MVDFGKKLSFGIRVVNNGQKSATVNALPQLIVNSTSGKFSITAPVSKALGVAVGERVMFLNNFDTIEDAILAKNEELVEFAAERGLDIESDAAHDAIMSEFGQWFIAKGIARYDDKGNPVMTTLRFSTEDKKKYIEQNLAEIIAANREALLGRLGVENATDEELASAISTDDVESPSVQDYTGAKTATTSSNTGVGCALNFTDTAIWNQIKSDIVESERNKVNRVFDVVLEEATVIPYSNGYKDVDIKVIPISFKADEAPKTVAKSAE